MRRTGELREKERGTGDRRWEEKSLDELGFVARGRSKHRPRDAEHLYGGPYPFIQTADVKHADLYVTSYSQTYSEAGLAQSKLWPAGTLCITIAANIADTAILGLDACFPDSVIGFMADNSKCDVRFIKYQLDTIKQQYEQVSHGAAQDNLPLQKLLAFKVRVPAVAIQRRIADILCAYDELIENNRRRMALLEHAARLIYEEWFVRMRFPGHEHGDTLAGVPQGWRMTSASEVLSILSGGTPKTTVGDFWDGDIPFYTPKDAGDSCYVHETERGITEAGLKSCNSGVYGKDTVFVAARGTVGKLRLAYRPMAMSQSCYAIIGKGGLSQLFVYCALQKSVDHLRQQAAGAVFDAIVVDTFKRIPFLVPDVNTVSSFDGMVGPIFRQIGNLLEQNQELRAARDLLLPRLMSAEFAI